MKPTVFNDKYCFDSIQTRFLVKSLDQKEIQESIIDECESGLSVRDSLIAAQDTLISKKTSLISNQKQVIAKKDSVIVNKDRVIKNDEKIISDMKRGQKIAGGIAVAIMVIISLL